MQTSIPVIPVSPVAPTSLPPATPVPEVMPVSLFEDAIEKITPPMEFRAWLEKLKTYAEAARGMEAAGPQPGSVVAQAEQATPTPPTASAVPESVPAESGGATDEAAANTRQAETG